MRLKLSLQKILNEMYPVGGGSGEEILHKDLMPHLQSLPGTEELQKWLNDKGSVPENIIPRIVKDRNSLNKIKQLLPQLKAARKQRYLNPQQQKDFNPYEELEQAELTAGKNNPLIKGPEWLKNLTNIYQRAEKEKNDGRNYYDIKYFLYHCFEELGYDMNDERIQKKIDGFMKSLYS